MWYQYLELSWVVGKKWGTRDTDMKKVSEILIVFWNWSVSHTLIWLHCIQCQVEDSRLFGPHSEFQVNSSGNVQCFLKLQPTLCSPYNSANSNIVVMYGDNSKWKEVDLFNILFNFDCTIFFLSSNNEFQYILYQIPVQGQTISIRYGVMCHGPPLHCVASCGEVNWNVYCKTSRSLSL